MKQLSNSKRGDVGNTSDKQNTQGLKQLLGDDLDPAARVGGWVADHLRSNPPNANRVKQLSQQVREIWAQSLHRGDHGEPYKLAQRIVMLSHEIGVVPCYNCKSGKDRTGMLDCEIKQEAVLLHGGHGPSEIGQIDAPHSGEVFEKVLKFGGNREVQQRNTGAPGNKVLQRSGLLSLSYKNRLSPEVYQHTQGLADLVKS